MAKGKIEKNCQIDMKNVDNGVLLPSFSAKIWWF